MPERTFGRTVKHRRSLLGLSQAKLGELVGRSPASIRSWERDKSHPSEPAVISALAAVLGIDEQMLFEKAGQSAPEVETNETIEQALATLGPEVVEEETGGGAVPDQIPQIPAEPEPPPDAIPEPSLEVTPAPAQTASHPPQVVSPAMPPVNEPSYMEDRSQRQLYRVRNLATIVALVALGIMLLWAFSESFDAIGAWWDEFFGNLRL
ncbi:MAG: helix-turn-helix transcriptional regulator [Actinomycetota bacterium]|nr:helix-turn-helix transcriptional regulator [Actinomycetota bacterium]